MFNHIAHGPTVPCLSPPPRSFSSWEPLWYLREPPTMVVRSRHILNCDPSHVTRISVYSLALRLRRICFTEDRIEQRALELKDKLLDRGYKETMVQAEIQRAREVPRNVALEKVNKNDKNKEKGRQLGPNASNLYGNLFSDTLIFWSDLRIDSLFKYKELIW